ncbi:MAG: holo-[acyl-carrier-protein] synthase [Verrucomicrobia bacterium]|nr:holo-[acyl-carrier-protein] synthase [Verrucomicrobiota bacterium]
MAEMLRRWGCKFKDKVFLKSEQAYCDSKASPHRHYAGRFAVKEAVTKAFGTGITPQIGWLDVEVERDRASGAPSVRLSRRGQSLAVSFGAHDVLISLSHTRNYAVAQALLVQAPGRKKINGGRKRNRGRK